jgi:hypothetical protein
MLRVRARVRIAGAAIVIAAVFASPSLAAVTPASAALPEHRAEWMRRARWGVMVHYLADWMWQREADEKGLSREEGRKLRSVEAWNAMVDGFDVEALAGQLEAVGASYLLLSIGQNSGYYAAPNATYDRIVGIQPSHCSRRDLISDMADALAKRDIRLLVYLPSGAPAGDETARTALQWTNGPHPNLEFRAHWEAVVRDWSQRWGKKVSGWWFDGCYWPGIMYRGEAPNFATLAAAARAGNPGSVIAFNPGVYNPVFSLTEHADYIGGEVSDPTKDLVKEARLDSSRGYFDGKTDGVQLQVLTYLGEDWGTAAKGSDPDRFGDDDVVAISLRVIAYGGAITWDVPVARNGTMPRRFQDRLTHLGKVMDTLAVGFGVGPRRRP